MLAERTGRRRIAEDNGAWHLLAWGALVVLSAETSLRNAPPATRERSLALVERARALPLHMVTSATYRAVAAITFPRALRAPDLDIEAALDRAEAALLGSLPNGGTQ